MGLDAFVRCRCLRDGLTTDPPVPRELITEEDPEFLTLTVPFEGNEEAHLAFERWAESSACAHRDLKLVRLRVANWFGVRRFTDALEAAGAERFPVLLEELPGGNGGSMSAEACRRGLAELALFEGLTDLADTTWLVDAATGTRLIDHLAAYDGVFLRDGSTGHNAGLDAAGFFIERRDDEHTEIFRSANFAQESLGDGRVRFTDAETGTDLAIPLSAPVRTGADGRYPKRLAVRAQATTPADFAPVPEHLARLFGAADATGNPVIWY